MGAKVVRCDYDRLAQVGQAFREQADCNRQMLALLQRQMMVLQDGDWVGQGASAFYGEMESTVLPTFKRLVKALESAQQVTGEINRVMHQAEDDAAAVFRAVGSGIPAGVAAGVAAGLSGGSRGAFDADAGAAGLGPAAMRSGGLGDVELLKHRSKSAVALDYSDPRKFADAVLKSGGNLQGIAREYEARPYELVDMTDRLLNSEDPTQVRAGGRLLDHLLWLTDEETSPLGVEERRSFLEAVVMHGDPSGAFFPRFADLANTSIGVAQKNGQEVAADMYSSALGDIFRSNPQVIVDLHSSDKYASREAMTGLMTNVGLRSYGGEQTVREAAVALASHISATEGMGPVGAAKVGQLLAAVDSAAYQSEDEALRTMPAGGGVMERLVAGLGVTSHYESYRQNVESAMQLSMAFHHGTGQDAQRFMDMVRADRDEELRGTPYAYRVSNR